MEEVHRIYDTKFGCYSKPVVPYYVINMEVQEIPENWADFKDHYFWRTIKLFYTHSV
jgi:hypothetical protein